MAREYSNNAAVGTLAADPGAAGTTIDVNTTAGWPAPAVGNVAIGALDFGNADPAKIELFSYTGLTATTFTGVVRGIDGTVAQAHLAGTRVQHVASAKDIQNAARKNEAQTFTEDQTIAAGKAWQFGPRARLQEITDNLWYLKNARYDGTNFVRQFATNAASALLIENNGDLSFYTNTDAGTTVGSIITWGERFRITKVGVVTGDAVRGRYFGFSAQAGRFIEAGAGSPEGVNGGSPGSLWTDTTNGKLYIKESGTGNTGWKAIGGGMAIKSIQRGVHYANGLFNGTIAIAAVNMAKTVVHYLGVNHTGGAHINLSTSTGLNWVVGGNANYAYISWEVIEYA